MPRSAKSSPVGRPVSTPGAPRRLVLPRRRISTRSSASIWRTTMSLLSPDQATPNPAPSLVGAPDGAAAAPESGASARVALGGRSIGVAGRLLMLTVGFVLLAMGLFYASRLAAYRENWLRDRLMVAHSAMMLFGETGEETVPHELAGKILDTVGAKSIIVALPDGR